jgi:proteasome regulatory subunit
VSHEPDVNGNGENSEETEDLRESYNNLQERASKLEKLLNEAQEENQEIRQKMERLKKENEALKREPNYIGTVEEIIGDNQNIILKKHGDNQEFMVEYPDQIELDPGDRVALNESMGITQVIESADTDARAQAMEVDREPDLNYSDIGGLEDQLRELREATEDPILNPEKFDEIGVDPPSGVLLYGPPGTGKTMMAKAVANKTDATFLKLAASELAQKFIGEGARLVRDLFEVAKENSPTIIFIDEIDAIATKRKQSKSDGGAEIQRTLMQLLSEMDGFENRGDIRIIAATNRFDMLDDAILRPGRFDRIIKVPAPTERGREQIFRIHTRDMNISDDINYSRLAENADGCTGADIQATCTEAGMITIRDERTQVTQEDFEQAIQKVKDADQNPVKTRGFQ